jgi:hypothetical protein
MDTSNAVPEGEIWWSGAAPKPTQYCVADAPHAIPSVPDGAQQIINDIAGNSSMGIAPLCKE